ncbi:unnamed protein product [Symbiodinium natans]|uniref:Uncharacterized protein n=1 Tax=Symbiodinium natans TaxID=878477 RepID=A0A812UZQ2_9DINO|nr:unnamed protein product [Symbiodinium natans]
MALEAAVALATRWHWFAAAGMTTCTCPADPLERFDLLSFKEFGKGAPIARRTWRELGQLLAAKTGESEAVETEQLMQSLAVSLQRENARAILRRLGPPELPAEQLAEP